MKVTRPWSTAARIGRLATAIAVAASIMTAPTQAVAKPKVRLWVDAGHGGKDPGAMSGGLKEKDVNLQISRLVVKAAKRQGWAVKSTRTKDRFVSLAERPRRAKAWGATAFVAVHGNSMGKRPRGGMTIYRGKKSKRLGANIMRELKPLTDYKDIGNRRDVRGLAVLRQAKTPAVIVETLSLTSPKERKVLKSAEGRREIAEAIVRGVAEFQNVKYVPPGEKPKPKRKSEPKREPKRKSEPKPESKPESKPETDAPESPDAEKPAAVATSTPETLAAGPATPTAPATEGTTIALASVQATAEATTPLIATVVPRATAPTTAAVSAMEFLRSAPAPDVTASLRTRRSAEATAAQARLPEAPKATPVVEPAPDGLLGTLLKFLRS